MFPFHRHQHSLFFKEFGTTTKEHAESPLSQTTQSRIELSSCGTPLVNFMNDKIIISDEMKSFYDKNGFIIVGNALSNDQLQLWSERIDNAVNSRGIDHIFPEKDQMDVSNDRTDYFNKVFTQRINLWQSDELVKELLFNISNTLAKIACQLENIDSKLGVRLWHDQALYKEAFSNPISFHLDVPFWSFDSYNATTCWVALDDVDKQNGCMYYMAGSHKYLQQLPLTRSDDRNPFTQVNIGKNLDAVFEDYILW